MFTFPSINGQNNRSNFWMLDGINNQGAFTSTYAVPPIIDTIQEFKVQSHNDQAEFGGALGGIVNVVTKAGTNEFHGSAWEFLRNDVLDARNPFLASKAKFRQNQFGASFGGPVVLPKYQGRNKTFFYLGYQGFTFRRAGEALYRVPTEANLRGDFSDEPRKLYNPFTTRPDPNNPGTFIRDPFLNNQIPASMISPGMVLFSQQTLPKPISTGVADRNAVNTSPFIQDSHEFSARVDHNLTSKDSVWFRYSGLLLDQTQSPGRPAIGSIREDRGKNWAVSYVRAFSPKTLLQAQYGRIHVRIDEFSRFRDIPADFDKQVGFAETFSRNFQFEGGKLFPGINVSNFFSGGESNSLQPNMSNIHQMKANISKIVGNHTFRWGGELNTNDFEAFYNSSSVTFNTPQTGNPASPAGTGSELASFLLNLPDSAGRRNVHETMRWGGVLGVFFQDQWKVTPRLTVNLGFRYDRTFQPPYGAWGSEGENGGIETGAYDLQRGVYLIQKVPPACNVRNRAPCIPTSDGKLPEHVEAEPRGKIYHDSTDNWQPRVGLAYRFGQNTVLRGSFGMFFDNWAGVTQTAQNYEGGWPDVAQQLDNNINNKLAEVALPNKTGTNPFPEGLFPAATPFNQVLWYMDPNAKNPYSMQWNFGIQQQLNTSTVVTANYVGSGSRRLMIGGYYNVALTPGPGNPRLRSPFPYIAPTFYDRSWGRSNYHAFQFLLDKKFTSGLAYMVSYTWSKSIDIASSGWYGVEGHSNQDPYNFNNDRSVSGFDLPHVLSVNWVYQLPIGPEKRFNPSNRLLGNIIGNWQLNGIVLLRSGRPFGLTVPGDIANTGNTGYMRPNYVGGDVNLKDPTPSRWFNTDAFKVPAAFTFGTAGRHNLRSDGYWNLDLSVFRQFPFLESRRIEFRAEMFNATNSVVYGIPTGNIQSSNFGKVLGAENRARQVQLALKILF
jgi:outer membrane receptor protein involved in Fe transport